MIMRNNSWQFNSAHSQKGLILHLCAHVLLQKQNKNKHNK